MSNVIERMQSELVPGEGTVLPFKPARKSIPKKVSLGEVGKTLPAPDCEWMDQDAKVWLKRRLKSAMQDIKTLEGVINEVYKDYEFSLSGTLYDDDNWKPYAVMVNIHCKGEIDFDSFKDDIIDGKFDLLHDKMDSNKQLSKLREYVMVCPTRRSNKLGV